MQEFLKKMFTVWCESYWVGVSHVTSFCKTATDRTSYLKSTHTHTYTHTHILTHTYTHTNVTVQLILTHIRTWHICDQHGSEMCHTSLYDKAEQSDISVKGCKNGFEWQMSQQYPYCHAQFQALHCADNRHEQHTKIHQFTADRTANTKCGNQYRLQFQAFYVMFCSRHSSGGADHLVLSTVLGTLDSGHSALPAITEYEVLLCRWI